MHLRKAACTLLLATASLAMPVLGCTQTSNQMGDMKPDASKPMLSPPATAAATLGDTKIGITYNSPSMRGRKIMGGLVPYGHVWRTGANPATTLTTSADLHFGNLLVPAGTHTIYTYPSEDKWLLILNKQTGQWGTEYDINQDLGRIPMMAKPVATPQEAMTITFENTTPTSTELHIRWESTDRFVKITK
jgi:hypothetical protein